MTQVDIAIIGGSHAGSETAFKLRQGGFLGSIALLSSEIYLPYQRPPLSKSFLAGETDVEGILLRNASAYERANIAWHPATTVTAIDRAGHSLALAGSQSLTYGKLVIATGGRARMLPIPGAELAGIYSIRTIDDVKALRTEFSPGKRLVIVGAGYIGLEVAAVAVKCGLDVEVVEFASRVLARVAGPELSAFYEILHTSHGVKFRLNTEVETFLGNAQHVTGVRCVGGVELQADLVLVAAGMVPNAELAEAAGLAVSNGINVDEFCQTSDLDILAIGDCAEFPLPYLGRRFRLESVPNALEHARVAASVLNGVPSAYNAVPWFWSDQYDRKLQTVGLSQGHDQIVIRPPRTPEGFVAFYLKEGYVIAADCVNAILEFNAAKKLVTGKIPVNGDQLADPTVDIRTLTI